MTLYLLISDTFNIFQEGKTIIFIEMNLWRHQYFKGSYCCQCIFILFNYSFNWWSLSLASFQNQICKIGFINNRDKATISFWQYCPRKPFLKWIRHLDKKNIIQGFERVCRNVYYFLEQELLVQRLVTVKNKKVVCYHFQGCRNKIRAGRQRMTLKSKKQRAGFRRPWSFLFVHTKFLKIFRQHLHTSNS